MHDPHGQLMPWMIHLAEALPAGTLQNLASVLAACSAQEWGRVRLHATQAILQPQLRSLVVDMLAAWQQQAPNMLPADVALMLRTAAATARSIRESQTVELVWTGPLVAGPAMRRTDQALLQVIASAQQSLLIVSFAVYKIAAIAAAIVQAAERGVIIRICVEAPEPSGQKMAHDTIKALGTRVAQRAAIYVWPSDKRPTDASGKAGVLHAKCAVADSRLLFISSANLTESAMTLNMELGTLIDGGTAPNTVVAQFEQLIAAGVLKQMIGLS
jgi:phosphatidylserine/phosphatidylglycerophosphate/cardiolipin synthase-like enzyme